MTGRKRPYFHKNSIFGCQPNSLHGSWCILWDFIEIYKYPAKFLAFTGPKAKCSDLKPMGPSSVSLMPLNVKESLLLPPTLFVLILLFLAKQKGAFGLRTGVSIGCVGPRAEVKVSCNSARNIRASRTRHSSTISCSNSSGWKNDVIMKCVELDKKKQLLMSMARLMMTKIFRKLSINYQCWLYNFWTYLEHQATTVFPTVFSKSQPNVQLADDLGEKFNLEIHLELMV